MHILHNTHITVSTKEFAESYTTLLLIQNIIHALKRILQRTASGKCDLTPMQFSISGCVKSYFKLNTLSFLCMELHIGYTVFIIYFELIGYTLKYFRSIVDLCFTIQ